MSDITEDSQQEATQLPEPTGYRMLCALPEVEDKFANGLFKPDSLAKIEEFSTVVLFVLKMGPDCYSDASRFPTGPYCKEGDFILVRPHAGSRVHIHGKAFRLINDDSVEAIAKGPEGIERA